MTQLQRLLTTPEVAALLDEDERTVQRRAKAGVYPAVKLPGTTGAYVFPESEIATIARSRGYITLDCRDGVHSACETCSCTCHEKAVAA